VKLNQSQPNEPQQTSRVLTPIGAKKLELLIDLRNRFLATEEKKINQRRELEIHGQALALIIDVVTEMNMVINDLVILLTKEEPSRIVTL
jgi:hypothetical protein